MIKNSDISKLDIILGEAEKAFQYEEKRRDNLDKKTERFVAAIALVFGLHLIDLEHLAFSGNLPDKLYSWLAIGAILALGISLIVALLSNRVVNYYSYPRGTRLIDELKSEDISDDSTKIRIAGMYLKAHDINAKINDARAQWLSYSGIFLVSGFFLAIASHLVIKVFK
jgi:hypothetical protein